MQAFLSEIQEINIQALIASIDSARQCNLNVRLMLYVTPVVVCVYTFTLLPSPKCGQAFHWRGRFLVLQLGLEGLSGQVRAIERVVLGIFGEKTWFLCFIVYLGREVWTVMPPNLKKRKKKTGMLG